MEPERIADFRTRKYAEEQILCLRKNIIGAIKSLLSRGTQFFYIPEVKKAAMEQIEEDSRPSVLQKLHRRQEEINQREQTCTKPKKRSHGTVSYTHLYDRLLQRDTRICLALYPQQQYHYSTTI